MALVVDASAMCENVTFYDGLYVALAAALRAPLLTADERLSPAPRLGCPVELVRTA
jgi:predicted nucleic acid-binding protein